MRIDLRRMLRNRQAIAGACSKGTLNWTCGGEPSGSVGYTADMRDLDNAILTLNYIWGDGADAERVEQRIMLSCTTPHYGGRRWWMICPYSARRVLILYKPHNGDRFASREVWRVQYRSQRLAARDRPFEALFRLQKRLGCPIGWEQPIRRPKGMWQRTYARLEDHYFDLDAQCAAQMAAVLGSFR